MDEDVIDALADALRGNMECAHENALVIQRMESVIFNVAQVINSFEPTYDLRYFYRRTGFCPPYPEHPMMEE